MMAIYTRPRLLKWLLPFALTVIVHAAATAQTPAPADTTLGKLIIETSEAGEAFRGKGRELRKLSGSVRMRQDSTLIRCDTAMVDNQDAILIGNVLIEQGDSLKIFSDSTHYFGEERYCDLYGNVVLIKGQQQLFTDQLHYDLANKVASFHTGATLTNGETQLKSRHGYYFTEEEQIYFKGDVLVTDPEFSLRTDTMGFNTETQTVRFLAPTLISQREARIYTEGGFYDIENNYAEFDKNPQYERDGQRGRARKMRYVGTTKEYILEGDAIVEEPEAQRESRAQVIRYNTENETAVLVGDAWYRDSTQEVRGAEIRYDSRNKRFQLAGRGQVSDPPNIIEADSIDFSDVLGSGLAVGNVLWQDTAGDFSILAWRMDYNKQSEFLHAFGSSGEEGPAGRPLLKTLIDNDTLYMSADTLTSFKPDTITDQRLLLAYRDVRIFKSDLQASCDSLLFDSADSTFWFYQLQRLPIIWSDTSQFSADTIRLTLRDKKLDRIWLRQNALIVNSGDEQYFNQIKGRNITAYFRENEVREMLVDGNAQALYYALDDDKAYIGFNETVCSEMRLFFGDNKVDNIRYYQEPKGTFTPMKKAGNASKKLEGFFWDWQNPRRPRSLDDLLLIRNNQ